MRKGEISLSKKVLKLFAYLLSLVMLLCACQISPEHSDDLSTTGVSTENVQKALKKNDQATEKTTDESAIPAWKTAYLDFIESNKNAYLSYALVYVDDDDIPELYMSGVCEADGDRICSYKNGTVMDAYMNRIGAGRYVERSGNIINQNGHMGLCHTTAYKLDENGFTKTFSALSIEHVEYIENTEDPLHPGNEKYKISYEYSIEGLSVSEEEYNAAVNAAFDFAQSVEFYDSAVSYDVIKQQILDRQ